MCAMFAFKGCIQVPSDQLAVLRAPLCVFAVSQSLSRSDTYCGMDGNRKLLGFLAFYVCSQLDNEQYHARSSSSKPT